MSSRGAPKGNNNAGKAKIWTAAIERALAKVGADKIAAIDAVAETLVRKCLDGDVTAIKEIGDRLEGKPVQQQILTGEDGGPVRIIATSHDENL